jgi:hypothetical protein
MASTYTTSLKIQEIATGDQSGTWGSTTNTNWTLIEQAVAGTVNITMANANYTLSNLNGVSDEARNMVLIVGGTTGGAGKQIIAPLVPKFYVVTNNTSDLYSINIGASTGAVITIPSGVTAQVYCDGTNFYSAQTGSAGNFYVNGTLTAAGIADVGNINISGNVSASGTLTVAGNGVFSGTGALTVPVGTTAQEPGSPTQGMIRFNSDTPAQFEGYNGVKWGAIGGGASAGGAVYENSQNIVTNYTMTTGYSGESVGPINIASAVSVVIPAGSRWVIL